MNRKQEIDKGIYLIREKSVLCAHGGFGPSLTRLQQIKELPKYLAEPLINFVKDLLWADAQPGYEFGRKKDIPHYGRNYVRACSFTANVAAVLEKLEMLGIDMMVRAHNFCMQGVHFFADSRFITIFSATGYDGNNNIGTTMTIEKDFSYHFTFYKDETNQDVPDLDAQENPTLCPEDELEIEESKAKHTLRQNEDLFKKNQNAVPRAPKVATKKTTKGKSKLPSATLPSISMMIIIFIMYLVRSSYAAPTLNSFEKVADKSSTLARFINGVFIGESLSSGTLDKKQLIDELFPLGPGVSMDSLSKLDLSGFLTDLNSIQKVVDEKCSEGCGISKTIFDHMETFSKFKEHIPAMNKVLSATGSENIKTIERLETFISFRRDIVENSFVQTLEDKIAKLVNDLKESSDNDATVLIGLNVKDSLSKIKEFLDTAKNAPSLLDEISKKALPGLAKELEVLSSIEAVYRNFEEQKNTINTLKLSITSAEGKFDLLMQETTDDKLKLMREGINLLKNLNHFTSRDKKITAGFVQGFKDLQKSASDDQNQWLKSLNPGANFTLLSSKLAPLKKFTQDVTTFALKFENVKLRTRPLYFHLNSIVTADTGVFSKLRSMVSAYKQCVEMVVNTKLDSYTIPNKLEFPSETSENLKASISSFLNVQGNSLDNLANLLEMQWSDVSELKKTFFVNSPTLQKTIDDIRTLKSNAKTVNHADTKTWLEEFNVGKIGSSTRQWIENSHIINSMKCVDEKGNVEKLKSLNPSAEAFGYLKSGTQDMETITKHANSIVELSKEWKKVEPKLSTGTRPKRETKHDLAQISKNLGDISSTIDKMAVLLKYEADLSVLIGATKQIESAIEAIPDQEIKSQLTSIWNSALSKSLEANLNVAKKVSTEASNIKEIRNLSDFQKPFEIASEVQKTSMDIGDLAIWLNGKIGDPKVAGSLEAVKMLDLSFASYQKANAKTVLNDLQNYFHSVFGSNASSSATCTDCSTTSTDSDGPNIWLWVGIGVGSVLLIVGLSYLAWRIYDKKYRKPVEIVEPQSVTKNFTAINNEGRVILMPNNGKFAPSEAQKQQIFENNVKIVLEESLKKPKKKSKKEGPKKEEPPMTERDKFQKAVEAGSRIEELIQDEQDNVTKMFLRNGGTKSHARQFKKCLKAEKDEHNAKTKITAAPGRMELLAYHPVEMWSREAIKLSQKEKTDKEKKDKEKKDKEKKDKEKKDIKLVCDPTKNRGFWVGNDTIVAPAPGNDPSAKTAKSKTIDSSTKTSNPISTSASTTTLASTKTSKAAASSKDLRDHENMQTAISQRGLSGSDAINGDKESNVVQEDEDMRTAISQRSSDYGNRDRDVEAALLEQPAEFEEPEEPEIIYRGPRYRIEPLDENHPALNPSREEIRRDRDQMMEDLKRMGYVPKAKVAKPKKE
ncbi:unnamed protein product [Caenorhabditis nigoni]